MTNKPTANRLTAPPTPQSANKKSPERARIGRHAYRTGKNAEQHAEAYLKQAGGIILARRWRAGGAEIDLVASCEGTLALVEVKRRGDLATALLALTKRQQTRIEYAAQTAWNTWGANHQGLRFDLIVVLPNAEVMHYPDWWRVGD